MPVRVITILSWEVHDKSWEVKSRRVHDVRVLEARANDNKKVKNTMNVIQEKPSHINLAQQVLQIKVPVKLATLHATIPSIAKI